jgi:alpha-amylase
LNWLVFKYFRFDAAKHMWPADLEVVQNGLHDLNTTWFPAGQKPFIYLEVIDQNNPDEVRLTEYTHLGRQVI